MSKNLTYLLFISFLWGSTPLFAQNSYFFQTEEELFIKGLNAFEHKTYGHSAHLFEKYLTLTNNSDRRTEANYYLILCKKALEQDSFETELIYFIESNPNHPLTTEAYIVLGNYYYEQNNYQDAIFYLKRFNILSVRNEEDAKTLYRLAYAYFITNNYGKSKTLFNVISVLPYDYALEASYYLAYIYWKEEAYNDALLNLTFARNNPKYSRDIDEITIDIYYKTQQYDTLLNYIKSIETKTNLLSSNMYLLIGEAYFIKGIYEEAIQYFQQYILQVIPEQVEKQIWYRLGYANFKIDNFLDATNYLKKVANFEDSIAQKVSYLLAIIYLEQDEKQLALAAFDKARIFNFDQKIQKESAFYFIKVSYELGNYSNVIAESYNYLADYKFRNDDIQFFITNSYLNTGDYAKALDYLNSIENRSTELNTAYQITAFNKATQDYQDGQYEDALNMFKESLAFPLDQDLVNLSYYWLGEIYLLYDKPKLALDTYQNINRLNLVYQNAQYSIAYAYYYLSFYEQAQEYFYNFISATNVPIENKVDAWIRLGDCYFIQKNMNNALLAYREAEKKEITNHSYINFQIASIYKYLNSNQLAIQYFDKVINSQDESPYVEKAYYHKGIMFFDQENYDLVVSTYSTFIQMYGQSILLPYIYSKRALAYNLVQANNLAIKDYKFIIDNYRQHVLATNAIQALQEIHNNDHFVPNLITYIQKFKDANPESTATIEGDFIKAKKPFEEGKYKKAIETLKYFVKTYKFNHHLNEANYKIAYAFEKLGNFKEAIVHYNLVKKNYKIKAVRNTADLYYQLGQYIKAIDEYAKLKTIALTERYLFQAIVGLMKSYYQTGNYKDSQHYSQQILDKNLSQYFNEALLYQGKIFFALKDFNKAISNFQKITQVNQGVLGAESQYYIGCIYREKGDYIKSTIAFINVKKNYEAYLKWIYESYLLIAENYIDVDDIFQAKATLKSIYDNSTDKNIKTQAQNRLESLRKKNIDISTEVRDTLK